MAQLSKAALLSDITINIHTNVIKSIKGDTAQARFINLMDSTLNKTDDANANNGYMAIDSTGHADVSKIKSIVGSVGKFLRDDGTWAFAVVAPGVTNDHIPYQDASNDLADTPLIYDVANSRITLPIPLYISNGAGNQSVLTSTTDQYYIGGGNDAQLAAATLYARTYHDGVSGAGNLWQADVANGTTIGTLSIGSNTLGGTITDGTLTGLFFADPTGFTAIASDGTGNCGLSLLAGQFALSSTHTSFMGGRYDGAIVAGYVAANGDDYTWFHRGYNDTRYTLASGGPYLPLAGGTMTGVIFSDVGMFSTNRNFSVVAQSSAAVLQGSDGVNTMNQVVTEATDIYLTSSDGLNNSSTHWFEANTQWLITGDATNYTKLAFTSTTQIITSNYSSFVGIEYSSATATIVDSHNSQYSLLHRNAGDTRWAQLSGATFTGNVNGVTPTSLGYLSGATSNIQNQLNNLAIGIGGWKTAARVMLSTNVTISSPGATLDGVTMASGDRVVLNGQTTGSQNGVYVYNGSSSAMTRATDCSTGDASNTGVLGMVITIEEGTYADQFWVLTNNATITVGSTSLVYAKGSATTYTGSAGITLTGNNFTLDNSYFSGAFTLSGGVATIGAGYVTNAMLANSTISGKALGTNLSALTIGTGLSGTSYNGSGAITIAIDSTVATLTGAQALSNKTGNISQWTNDSGYALLASPIFTGHITVEGVTATGATGTGKFVFDNSPSLTTPTLGVASATSLAITGTAGNGFTTFLTQSSQAAYGASGFAFYANSLGRFSWRRQSDTFERSFAGTLTADRIYTLQDSSDTFVMRATTDVLTNKDLTSTTNTFPITPFQPFWSGKWRTTIFNGALSASTGWAGGVYWIPYFINATHTVTDIGIEVTTLFAASNINLALYSDNNGTPGSLIEASGNISAASTGQKTYTFTGGTGSGGSQVLLASSKMVWLAIQASSNSIGIRSAASAPNFTYVVGSGANTGFANQTQSFTTFPSPAVPSGFGQNIPLICLKAQ